MTNPIQRNQNIFNEPVRTQPVATKLPAPQCRDMLIMAAPPQRSFLGSMWDSITKCFNSIVKYFRSFFERAPAPPRVDQKTQIQQLAARDHFVWFYKKEENDLTAFMGNFHPCPIHIWGMTFQCAEAAYQAAKFDTNRATMARFQNLTGKDAFQLGRQLGAGINNTAAWRARSLTVMDQVVQAKFAQNPALKELLLATGNAFLVEHIPVKGRDAFFGDDSDGTGQNMLGAIMMATRGRLGGSPPVPRNAQYNSFLTRQP
jgi:ribA/ribD-fused uncharacterized protein